MAFSHRDRRVQRSVARGLIATTAGVVGLTVATLLAPDPWLGLLALALLGAAGFASLFWGHTLVAQYAADTRRYREGFPMDGFARAELGSRFGLDRPVGHPTGQSPHSRAAARASRSAASGSSERERNDR